MLEKEYMNQKYQLDVKWNLYVIQQLKVKISKACINIRQYNVNWLQYHQNKLFKTNQSRLYIELIGDNNSINESPNPEEATNFGEIIWATTTGHNPNSEWLWKDKNRLKDLKCKTKSLSPLKRWNMGSEGWQVGKPWTWWSPWILVQEIVETSWNGCC